MMMEAELFAVALGLHSPWNVSGLNFSVSDKRLDINIDFEAGGLFPCPVCGTKVDPLFPDLNVDPIYWRTSLSQLFEDIKEQEN